MMIMHAPNYENLSPLLAAWTLHYMSKGCTDTKAIKVAFKRIRSGKRTWPQLA